MATFNLDENPAAYQIRAYQPGQLQINEKIFQRSVIVTPDQLIEHWPVSTITQLTPASLTIISDLKPDILLIGTGSKLTLIPIEIYGALLNQHIGVEVMDTAAACRTYNALSAEARNVAAALIIA